MSRRLRCICAATLIVLASLPLAGCALLRGPVVLDDWEHLLARAEPGHADVTVTFLGVSTLLIRDGETALLTDGFFSRPGLASVVFDWDIEPDAERIEAGLALGEIERVDALMTVHSHYDHAMDVAEVASRTGAMVLGSESTANVARGGGLAEDQIRVVAPGEPMRFGPFEVTFLESKHYPLPPPADELLGKAIAAPLVPPAPASAYLEGASYTIHIAHPLGTAIVQGSAGYVEHALDEVTADVVLLGIGGLGNEDAAYQDAYWDHVVRAVGARRVLPVHWDDFTLPLDEPLRAFPTRLDDLRASLAHIVQRGEAEGRRVELLPLARPVPLFEEGP